MKRMLYTLAVACVFIYVLNAQQAGQTKIITLAPEALYNYALAKLNKGESRSKDIVASLLAWRQIKDQDESKDELDKLNEKDFYPNSTALVQREEKKVAEITKDNGATWDALFNAHKEATLALEKCKDTFKQTIAQEKVTIMNSLDALSSKK